MQFLNVSGVSRQEGLFVLKNVTFSQTQFEKIAIAGETGSGKSSLLKIIAGLVQAQSGEVSFDGVRILGPEEKLMPGHKGIAYLSQHFELPNNYVVEDILNFENKLPDEVAETLYEVCRIKAFLKRKTRQLSGGEKQRIAIARLLISSPRLLLLDEPYSNLDMIHKNFLKAVIKDIGERLKISCILISHDPLDTLSWADTIIVMKGGEIVQKGSPKEIYSEPVNAYVAGLFGKYNIISHAMAEHLNIVQPKVGEKNLFLRPEGFTITKSEKEPFHGYITEVYFAGSYYEIEVLIEGQLFTVKTGKNNFKKGDAVNLAVLAGGPWYI